MKQVFWLCGLLFISSLALSQEKALIKGQLMFVDKNTGNLVIEKEVTGFDPGKNVHFSSGRLEIVRDPVSDKVTFAKAEGSVKVMRKQEYAYFDQGVFKRNLSLITVEGKLQVGTEQIRIDAHRAVYDTAAKTGVMYPLPSQRIRFLFHKENPKNRSELIPVTGVADEVRVFEDLKKLILQGHVEVNDPQEPSQFKAGRVVAFFDEASKLEEMTASGGFEMSQPGRDSSSRRAVLSYETDLIVLLGQAKVLQVGEGEVQGERIEMHMDAKKGFIRGQRKKPLRIEIPLN